MQSICIPLLLAAVLAAPIGEVLAQDAAQDSHFQKVVLMADVTDPNEIGIAPDGSVFVAERAGPIKMWDPETGETRMVGFIPVRMTIEDGLMGLTLDPNFAETHWIYVYYAPASGGPSRLSRFTFRNGEIDIDSEAILLEVNTQQKTCCHSAGSLTFGPDGSLYLSTGDNTDPYPLGGSSIDETNMYGDAQRTSANTNDLRGKILRIMPQPDGTYTIPEGNLFEGDALHRPEIYTMGNRNPYRIAVDPETGWLYWGDVGIGNPPSEERGPWGWEEFNRAKEPGFYGWPQFAGPNDAYRDFDYSTQTPGEFFNSEAPVNDSPHNTGAENLPPAKPALIWYTYGPSEEFPELGAGGMSAMGGPIYRYDESFSPHALPAEYDGSWIIYEWMRNWIKEVTFDADGELDEIKPFLADLAFSRPSDIEIGPDGRLYVLEWGESFWGSNPDAQVVRVDYYKSGPPPAASDTAVATSEAALVNDRDNSGISIVWPPDGGFFEYGERIPFEVDAAEGDDVVVQAFSGHDTHAHPFEPITGREGDVTIWRRFVHVPDIYYQDEFAEIEVRTADGDRDVVRLHPRRLEAEHTASRTGDAERKTYGEHPAEYDFPATAMTVLALGDGDEAVYAPINLANIDSLRIRVKSSGPAVIDLSLDEADNVRLASIDASAGKPVSAGDVASQRKLLPADVALAKLPANTRVAYEGWRDVTIQISDPGGTHRLVLTTDAPVEIDWLYFVGRGVAGR